MKKTILRFSFIILAVNTIFISAGYAAAIHSASCSQVDVQAAITAASTGDVVIIPSGSCTWTTRVNLAKSIILKGGGAGNTKITHNSTGFAMQLTEGPWRITGIGFTVGASSDGIGYVDGAKSGWRIDHCTFTYSGTLASKESVMVVGERLALGAGYEGFGLFDNNTLTDVRVPAFYGGGCNFTNVEWTNSAGLGTANALFIENNTIINARSGNLTQPDANCGSRVVFRYNTMDGFNSAMHSDQGGNRGARMWEFYGNTYTANVPTWIVAHLRAGTGVMYNNTIGNGFTDTRFGLDNVRSFESRGAVGMCDGTSSYDGNRTGGYGYPCRDQIGRSTDAYQMTAGNFPPQSLSPAYFWNNKKGSTEVVAFTRGISKNESAYHILENRDYYNYTSSFDGTAGVGSGLLANRPVTCTTNASEAGGGVAYWATDTNTLYRCSATNTWTVHYKPYTYPHPLTRLEPPQTLRIKK